MEQLNLFDLMDILKDGDLVDFSRLRSICSFDWLCNNIGKQVAVRRRTEINLYYIVGTIIKVTLGTWQDGCKRVCISTGRNRLLLLDEPLFYLGYKSCCHYVYEL